MAAVVSVLLWVGRAPRDEGRQRVDEMRRFHDATGPEDGMYSRLLARFRSSASKRQADIEQIKQRLVVMGADAVPSLMDALGDENHWVQFEAAQVLAEIGPAAKPAIPALLTLLNDPVADQMDSVSAPAAAAEALAAIGAPALPHLIQSLASENPAVRQHAACALGSVRPVPNEAPPLLIGLLSADSSPRVRWAAAVGIGRTKHAARKAVEALMAALEDQDGDVRHQAAWAIGQMGPEAIAATSALIKAMEDRDWRVRWMATGAVASIGASGSKVTGALQQALADDNAAVRQAAEQALAKGEDR